MYERHEYMTEGHHSVHQKAHPMRRQTRLPGSEAESLRRFVKYQNCLA